MMKKRLISVLLILAVMISLVACSSNKETETGNNDTGSADKQYVLKHAHVLSASEPFHKGFENWAKAVEERTNGGLKIEVYPAGQLGVEEDILEQAKQGVNVSHNTDAARLGMYVDEIAVMNGPYFVENLDEVEKLKDSPTLQKYIDEIEEYGLKVLSYNWVQTHRH